MLSKMLIAISSEAAWNMNRNLPLKPCCCRASVSTLPHPSEQQPLTPHHCLSRPVVRMSNGSFPPIAAISAETKLHVGKSALNRPLVEHSSTFNDVVVQPC